jgi:hypothetical protein
MQRLNRCDSGGNKVAVLEQTAASLPNFIGGEWHKSGASDFVDVFNPATGEVLASRPRFGSSISLPRARSEKIRGLKLAVGLIASTSCCALSNV